MVENSLSGHNNRKNQTGGTPIGRVRVHVVMKLELATETILPLLNEEDLEQMRRDTQRLRVENELLRRRIVHLECQIVTHGWAGWHLH
jgi:hypothetical protein